MCRYDDNCSTCDEVGDRHFGVFLVEESVDHEAKDPSEEGLHPDHGDRVVELYVLDFVFDFIGLFETRLIKRCYIFSIR